MLSRSWWVLAWAELSLVVQVTCCSLNVTKITCSPSFHPLTTPVITVVLCAWYQTVNLGKMHPVEPIK